MAGSVWGRIVDAVVPGDVYNNTTGQWNPATLKTGLIGMAAGQLVPGGGYLTRKAAERGMMGGTLQNQLAGEGFRTNLVNSMIESRAGLLGDLARPSLNVGNVGIMGHTPTISAPTQLSIQQAAINSAIAKQNTRMDATQQGIQSKINAAGNRGSGNTGARAIGGNLSYSGGRSGYNNGVGAGTGFGASSYQNDSWGSVASGFGVGGMQGGARDQPMPMYKGLK